MSILDLQVDQHPIEVQKLKAKMEIVQSALLADTPGLSDALKDIHQNLQQHEDLIHLFDDDDMARIHKAFEKHKQVRLIQEAVTTKKKTKKLTDSDLNNL